MGAKTRYIKIIGNKIQIIVNKYFIIKNTVKTPEFVQIFNNIINITTKLYQKPDK